ncbi:hypothetical protein CRYUN_Cryun06bG0124000 [Craigia yunnanensis]
MALMQRLGRTKNVTRRSKKYLEEALYNRIFKEGSMEISVRQQLNQFLKSSKRVYKWEVDDTLKKLRDRKLYYPSLKVGIPIFDQSLGFIRGFMRNFFNVILMDMERC